MNLNQRIDHWSQQTPDAIAIQFGEQSISFGLLADMANRAAGALQQIHNVQVGDRVTYLGLNHPNMLVVLLACEKLGAIFNPLNTRPAAA